MKIELKKQLSQVSEVTYYKVYKDGVLIDLNSDYDKAYELYERMKSNHIKYKEEVLMSEEIIIGGIND